MSLSQQAAAVELFSTSILSNHKIRSRHERYVSILSVKKIPYIYHDLAGDEEAKSRWRRKARDPQIPGLLVHNEWRGTFEEFEESIEFGELDLFLKIDDERAYKETKAGLAPSLPDLTASSSTQSVSSSLDGGTTSKQAPRTTSHSVATLPRLAQPRAPSQANLAPALPFAPSGSGRRKEHDAESFLSSLGISDLNLTEEELNEILEGGQDTNDKESSTKSASKEEIPTNGERGQGKYPSSLGLGTSKPAVPRMYIPSADAGIKPIRLARMGEGSQRSATTTSPLRLSPSARYNASQLSSKALAAEAHASISSRSFSSVKLREAVSKGDKLEDAFSTTRAASNATQAENVVGREDLDDLMASLGLGDVKMSEEEAEAFLLDGTIPTGLDSHGSRLGRAGSVADRARNEAAARDVAQRARERGHGAGSSRPSSLASSIEVPAAVKAAEAAVKTMEIDKTKEGTPDEEATPVKAEVEREIIDKVQKDTPLEATTSKSETEMDPASDPVAPDLEAKGDAGEKKGKPSVEGTPKQRDVSLPHSNKGGDIAEASIPGNDIGTDKAQGTYQEVAGASSIAGEGVTKPTASGSAEAEAASDLNDKEDVSIELSPATDSIIGSQAKRANQGEATEAASEPEASAPAIEDVPPAILGTEEAAAVQGAKEAESNGQEYIVNAGHEGTRQETNRSTHATEEEVKAGVGEEKSASAAPQSARPVSKLLLDDSISSFAGMIDFGDSHLDEKERVAEAGGLALSSPPRPTEAQVPSPSGQMPMSPPERVRSPPSASTSSATARKQLRSPSLTPSRRGMDVPRKISSSSLSETYNPTRRSIGAAGMTSPPPNSAISEMAKSPKSSSKKFFSLGRRKDRRSTSKASDSDEDVFAPSIPASGSNSTSRDQKTLSMILREADEAMEDLDEDEAEDGLGREGSQLGDAFDLELDGLDEDDGIELAAR